MLAKQIDVQTAQGELKELLTLIQSGTEIILTDGDKVFARIVPVESELPPRIPNLHPGGWMSDDFDAPLPDEFWLGEEISAKNYSETT